MKKIIKTSEAPAPVGPYSQAVEANGFVFCSGQISLEPKSNELIVTDIEAQTEQVLMNIKAVLKASGLELHHIIKTTIFLTNIDDFSKVNEIYSRYFLSQPPARSTVEVSRLPKGVNIEIEVVAYRS